MFDIVVGGLNDTRNEQHAIRQGHLAEHLDLVLVARIGKGQTERADLRLIQDRQDLRAGYVVHVRAVAIAPARMEAELVGGDVGKCQVERRHVHFDGRLKLFERTVLKIAGALHRHVRCVDLQDEPPACDVLVLLLQLPGEANT